MEHLFELLLELIEFLEPYMLVTTIFFIPCTITITSLPKRFFAYEFTQHLLPSLYDSYARNRLTLEKVNAMTQNLMVVLLMLDLFSLAHFFFGGHGEHESAKHHEVSQGVEHGRVAEISNYEPAGEHVSEH